MNILSSNETSSQAQAYGYGSLSVLIICILSIFGILIFPMIPRRCYQIVTSFMCSLAVGALTGDALFHLIPTAFGLHEHENTTNNNTETCSTSQKYSLTKTIVIVSGIYVFYVIDVILSMFTNSSKEQQQQFHHHDHDHPQEQPMTILRRLSTEVVAAERQELHTAYTIQTDAQINHVKHIFNFFKGAKDVSTYCWSVLIADMIHNFADGIAIGAAFSNNITLGLTTSIAIALHEIPHELGDYGIMLKAGLNHRQAVFLNFVTGLTAFIGLFIGIAISMHSSEQTLSWILAFTAGVFLYVALTDILPHFIPDKQSSIFHIIAYNIALLIGFVIMFLIAHFEEQIEHILA